MTIEDVHLPEALAACIRVAHEFATDIASGTSGFEQRNARHASARRHYVLDTGAKPLDEIRALLQFFEARRGRHGGFLLRDFLDPHSGTQAVPTAEDQPLLALSDPQQSDRYALVKQHPTSGQMRRIFKPRRRGFMLAEAGALLELDAQYTLDTQNGTVHIIKENIRGRLTAGFYFSVPVRFDTDRIDVTRLEGEMAQINPVPLVEIKLTDPESAD